jgi:hypothetical protein
LFYFLRSHWNIFLPVLVVCQSCHKIGKISLRMNSVYVNQLESVRTPFWYLLPVHSSKAASLLILEFGHWYEAMTLR